MATTQLSTHTQQPDKVFLSQSSLPNNNSYPATTSFSNPPFYPHNNNLKIITLCMNIHLFPFVPGTRQPEVARRCSWRSKLHTRNKQLFSSFSQKTTHKGALSSKRIDNTTAAAVAKSSIKLYFFFSPLSCCFIFSFNMAGGQDVRDEPTRELLAVWGPIQQDFSHTHHIHTHTHVGTCSSEQQKEAKLCFEFPQNKNGGKPRFVLSYLVNIIFKFR